MLFSRIRIFFLFQLDHPPILSLDHKISPAHNQITFLIPHPPPLTVRVCGPLTGREGQQRPSRTPRGSRPPTVSRTRSSVMCFVCWILLAKSLMISQGCLTRSRTRNAQGRCFSSSFMKSNIVVLIPNLVILLDFLIILFWVYNVLYFIHVLGFTSLRIFLESIGNNCQWELFKWGSR